MKTRTKWSAALLIGSLSVAGLITASVAVSQDEKPPAVDPAGVPGQAVLLGDPVGTPGAGAAPLGIPVVAPDGPKPQPPVGAPPARPPEPVVPDGPTGSSGFGFAPAVPSGGGAPTGSGDGKSDFFQPARGPAANVKLYVIELKHANLQSVLGVIETLIPTARGQIVADVRTNALILRVSDEVYKEIEGLTKILDAAVPNSTGAGIGGAISFYDKPVGKPSTGAGGTGAYYAGFTANSAAELRHEYEQHDRAARELAEAIKRGSKDQTLRAELRERVGDAFAARQRLLRFELADFQRRMKASQESIELRDRVANQIVDRRVSELLDPNLQWEPASSSLPGAGMIGMKGSGPTSMNRPVDDGMFRERNDQYQGGPAGGSGMKGSAKSTPLNRPVQEEMFREVPDRESRPGNNRPVPDPRIEHPLQFKAPAPGGPGAGATSGFGGSASDALPANAPDPASTLLESSPFELEPSRTPERRIVPSQDPFEMPPRVVSSKAVGTLHGRVIFDGPFTPLAPLYKKGDAPKDTSICGAEEIPDERVLVSGGSGLANVFIYLEKAPVGTTPPPVTGPLILDQSECIFQPRALVVRTDQAIRVFNSDPIAHNVHTFPIKSAVTNMVIAPNDNTGVTLKYNQSEKEPISIGCDIHPWMQAYHLPLNHSFAAVTNTDGEFEISDLPPGTHKFRVWHEAGKMLERELAVVIKPGDNDVKIRVSAGQLYKQLSAPAGGSTPKPTGTKKLPVNTIDRDPNTPKIDPAEPFRKKI